MAPPAARQGSRRGWWSIRLHRNTNVSRWTLVVSCYMWFMLARYFLFYVLKFRLVDWLFMMTTGDSKRTAWTTEDIIAAVRMTTERHDAYLVSRVDCKINVSAVVYVVFILNNINFCIDVCRDVLASLTSLTWMYVQRNSIKYICITFTAHCC